MRSPARDSRSNSNPQWDDLPIDFLIHETEDYVVFLDEDQEIDWATSDKYDDENRLPEDWGSIQTRYASLEGSLVDDISKSARKQAVRMLAEAVDRGLSGDSNGARETLDMAEAFIDARTREIGRLRYLYAAVLCTAPIVLLAIGSWLLRTRLEPFLTRNVFVLIFCAAAGSVGAFFLVLRDVGGHLPDPGGDVRLHRAEAVARILAGGLGAVLAVLCVKAGLLFPALDAIPQSSYLLVLLSFAAGASEKLVPTMVRKLEHAVESDKTAPK